MKRKLTKLWGIGLVIVLVASLFIAAAPASAADPLQWNLEPTPGPKFNLVTPGFNIHDYAISSDGMTVYAIGIGPLGVALYKSTNGGMQWTNISAPVNVPAVLAVGPLYVAVAPDDPDIVVVADGAVPGAVVSNNGGTTFGTMGTIQNFAGTINAGVIYDVQVSAQVSGGFRYVALPGISATPARALYYYNLGAAAPDWLDACADAPFGAWGGVATVSSIRAITFSPNFSADYMALVVSVDATTGVIALHILSFNSNAWDAALFAGSAYPVTVDTCVGALVFQKASIGMGPDYLGSDDVLRVAFVGLSFTDAAVQSGGIWRHDDDAAARELLAAVGINSVAFDGTNLVAGEFANNNVRRSDDPLASSPSVKSARSLKRIGVDDTVVVANDQVIVAWNGAQVVATKQGVGGAFAISDDNGMTWNDISLINDFATAKNIWDVYASPDGMALYYSTTGDGITSIYRLAGPVDQKRVLCVTAATAANLILRGAPENSDVIYAAVQGGTQMYYTQDGGVTRWQSRVAPGAVVEIAAESEDVVYLAIGAAIRKSLNGGFTWDPAITVSALIGAIYSMYSVAEDQLVIGDAAGVVAWTSDGGDTWMDAVPITLAGGSPGTLVIADGVAAGDHIYAADAGNNAVWRVTIGAGIPDEFKTMNVPGPYAGAETNQGMALVNGVLYVLSAEGVTPRAVLHHTLVPTKVNIAATDWTNGGAAASGFADATRTLVNPVGTPSNLVAAVTPMGTIKLYAIDTTAFVAFPPAGPEVYHFEDSVSITGPTLLGPEDGALIEVNPSTGFPYNVSFTWQRLSLANNYVLEIALDEGFSQLIVNRAPTGVTAANPVAINQVGGTGLIGNVLLPGTTYYWRIQTVGPIQGAYSETRTITVQPAAASVPNIGSPENGTTVTTGNPAFSWGPVAKTTLYEFELSADPSFATTLVTQQVAGAGVLVDVDLEPGTYFWRVRALEPVKGDWSTVANFIVAEAAPPGSDQPVINIPPIEIPDIVVPPPEVTVQEAPAEPAIPTGLLWAIIIIGAVLVIALIILIVRTRRAV